MPTVVAPGQSCQLGQIFRELHAAMLHSKVEFPELIKTLRYFHLIFPDQVEALPLVLGFYLEHYSLHIGCSGEVLTKCNSLNALSNIQWS